VAVRGSRLTRALLLGVLVVLIVGAGAALTVSAAQRRVPAVAASPGSAAAAVATSATAAARARSGVDVQPAAGPSNNQTVQLSPAARSHPRAEQVQQLLQAYFDAINNHDYDAWAEVVTAPQTQHQDSARWLQAYASTVDSSIWVQSLAGTPLQVAVRFTSEQDPELAPPDLQVDCIDWALSYQIVERDGQLVVGSTVPDTVSRTKCP
jgi:hypothetical protein